MVGELVFSVSGAAAVSATPISLADAGLRERQHLQEWVIQHPQILGDGVLIVTTEFDKWVARQGATPLDRLDVLGLDRSGHLVVAELKRDRAPDTVDMQALKYAAMASRFSLDTLSSAYSSYLQKHGRAELTPSDALASLQDWAPDLGDESLRSPRIRLIAGDFPPSVTATTVFLHENGLDITLTRVQAYRIADGDVVITVSQLWPVPTVEEFTISPRSSSQAKQQVARERKQRASIIDRIIGARELDVGAHLEIVPPATVGQDVEAIQHWLSEEASRSASSWTAIPKEPIKWEHDGRSYMPRTLITQVIKLATQAPPQADVWGPNWFQTADGRTLAQIGGGLPDPE